MKSTTTIEDFIKIAKAKGGRCLSKQYVNSTTKLKFKCKEGHQWDAVPGLIKKGAWCKKCSDNSRVKKLRESGLLEAQLYAKGKKGNCLSTEYISGKLHLEWECNKGHKWNAAFTSMKSDDRWCPHCSNRAKLTIELMQEIAESKGGKCLSKKYINIDTKLKWECKQGHQWETKPYLIKNGYWCPECNVSKRSDKHRGNIEDMHLLADSRNGKCLSSTYINSQTSLKWECGNGHQWKANPNNIKQGKWCPKCSAGIGERICRVFFEQLFNTNFDKVFPDWLLNDKGNQMELDGYNDKLKLAFEHQGGQHYYIDGFFIKTEKQLQRRKSNDRIKTKLCKENGILLLSIPEIPKHLNVGDVKAYLKKECIANNFNLPKNFDDTDVNLRDAYTPEDNLQKLKLLAQSNGGKCLSKIYLGSQIKMEWECESGHRWFTNSNNISQGKWCPTCAGITKLTIESMVSLARDNGGKCLSKKYINNRTALNWECDKGHKFNARPDNVKKGTWCPICGIKNRSESQKSKIEDIQLIAKKRNGKLISKVYISTHSKLEWECEKGHRWEAIPSAVRRGSWCPKCSGNRKATIEDMVEIAIKNKGKCLSKKYINTHTKLLWECENGHQWEAPPINIKKGKWCPKCKV